MFRNSPPRDAVGARIPRLTKTTYGPLSAALLTAALAASALLAPAASAAAAPVSAKASTSASTSTNTCKSAPVATTKIPANPFGANVTIFDPSMSVTSINAALNAAPTGDKRRQFYFLPGKYGSSSVTPDTATTDNVIQAQVASGTAVAGLGASPCDVVINGALSINNGGLAIRPSQMSNLTINPIQAGVPAHSMLWTASQTATLRRINLLGNLYVSPVTQSPGQCETPCPPGFNINVINGVSNGFVITNSVITGNVINGDGLNRPGVEGNGGNSDILFQQDVIDGTWSGFGSDQVFDGTIGAPADDFHPGTVDPYSAPGDIVTVDKVATVREQPWVYYNGTTFSVFNPSVQHNVRGANWSTSSKQGKSLPLSDFYLATAANDTTSTLNAALAKGKDLIVGPGTYTLTAPISVTKANKVILGLGDPILESDNTSTLVVSNAATGTVVAKLDLNGRAFDASDLGVVPFADNQIVIGTSARKTGSASNPTSFTDVNTVSGSQNDYLINQNYVILNQGEIQTNNNSGDGYTETNWVAKDGESGAIVNGNHVTWQGIWLEHFKKTEATWNGNSGTVQFLENERPLTVPFDTTTEVGVQPADWKMSDTFDGYPVLVVSPSVSTFKLDGYQGWTRLGNGCDCNITSNILSPVKPGITMHGLFSGEILGSTPSGTTASGGTIGGAFNIVNNDGVSASVPNTTGPANATSAWPYSDLAGHGATGRVADFPSKLDYGTLAVVATPTTVSGQVALSVAVTNNSAQTVKITVTTKFGSKTFSNVAVGKTVTYTVGTKLVSIPAGTVTVKATGSVVSLTSTVSYDADNTYVVKR
jgi:hypothetical protein